MIGCLYYFSLHFHSCCFYIQYHGGIKEIPCEYRYFVLNYILHYQHDEETLDSFIAPSYLRYKKGSDLNLPSSLFVATPLTYLVDDLVNWASLKNGQRLNQKIFMLSPLKN